MSKIHILNEGAPPSRTDPRWVPHTATLCGREFHLQSDFLTHKSSMYILADEVVCKTCLKVYKKQKRNT